jgi:hypothetical protein
MKTLTLPREFATGVYVASPDTGKERVYMFERIIDEEYEQVNAWLAAHPAAGPEEILIMLHDIALEWAAEDLGFDELDVLSPRAAAKLEIAYAK